MSKTRHHTSITRHNTRQHKTIRVQHEATRDNRRATQVQHETTQVQNNIKFILIYLYHRCILGTGILGSNALFMLQNFENWKSLFPATAKIELGNLQRFVAIALQFSVFLLIEITLIVSFFRFKTSYDKAFEWT